MNSVVLLLLSYAGLSLVTASVNAMTMVYATSVVNVMQNRRPGSLAQVVAVSCFRVA